MKDTLIQNLEQGYPISNKDYNYISSVASGKIKVKNYLIKKKKMVITFSFILIILLQYALIDYTYKFYQF